MKKPTKTAGVQRKVTDAKQSEFHPIVHWWPIHTPRLTGEEFKNPVADIPIAKSPLAQPEAGH